MTFDPNSPIARAPEVRVTMRGVRLSDTGKPVQVSTRSDFIAPDYAAPSTHQLEMQKGLAGWSEGPAPEDKRPAWIARAELRVKAQREADALEPTITGKTVVRKAPARDMHVMNRQGPSTRNRGKWVN